MVALLDDDIRYLRINGLDGSVDDGEPNLGFGGVAVPSKPTAAMLAAGSSAGNVSVEAAWRIYQAMIQSAS